MNASHKFYMGLALEEAHLAADRGEVPVGSVLIYDGQILARARNEKESQRDPTGHAELRVIQMASQALKAWRLGSKSTLYVTLEPCLMCAGAIVSSRLGTLVYGASDPKAGAVESLYQTLSDSRLNHQVDLISGVRAQECSQLLTNFFRRRRCEKNSRASS